MCTDILKLQDEHSKRKIEWYLHQKFYPLVAKGLFTEVRMCLALSSLGSPRSVIHPVCVVRFFVVLRFGAE